MASRWAKRIRVLRNEQCITCECPYHEESCSCVHHNLSEQRLCCTFHSSDNIQPSQGCSGCIYHNADDLTEIINAHEESMSSSSLSSNSETLSYLSEKSFIAESVFTEPVEPTANICNASPKTNERDFVNQFIPIHKDCTGSGHCGESPKGNESPHFDTVNSSNYTSVQTHCRPGEFSGSSVSEELPGGNDSISSCEVESNNSDASERSSILNQENPVGTNVEVMASRSTSPLSNDIEPSSCDIEFPSESSNYEEDHAEDSPCDDAHNSDSSAIDDPSQSPGSSDEIMTLTGDSLGKVQELVEGSTVRDGVALVLALTVRHSLPYVAAIHIFLALNTLLQKKFFPTSKKALWRLLKQDTTSIRKHGYCDKCGEYLGLLEDLGDPDRPDADVVCVCGCRKPPKKVKFFITLSMKKQLERLLKNRSSWENLQYRILRRKIDPTAVEDIFDGEGYKALMEKVDFSPSDFTYLFNTDGFKLTHSSKLKAWPLFIRLNEVRPGLRQKYDLLVGLWVDKQDPLMNPFLEAFVDEANELSSTGISWKSPDGELVRSRFFPTCCCADAKARAPMLNMMQGNGGYGCTFCDHCGVFLGGSMKYPLPGILKISRRRKEGEEEDVEIIVSEPQLRTHDSIRTAMLSATPIAPIHGVKGPSKLMNLNHFHLGYGFSTDDLHNLFKGVAEFHTERFFEDVGEEWYIGTAVLREVIDSRLIKIKTPPSVSRKSGDRPLDTMPTWKGSEWRNWLLYFAILCLLGLFVGRKTRYLNHFGLLCNAVFKLTRDVIRENDFVEAERCLNDYVRLFQQYFKPEKMRFNIHVLSHVVRCVRKWGPLWAHSTMGFESCNHKLGKNVKSPKDPAVQIVRRYFIEKLVENIPFDDNVSQCVKDSVKEIMTGDKFAQSLKIGDCRLYGEAVLRDATREERHLMHECGYICNELTEYRKAKIRKMEVRSFLSADDARSDHRHVYTLDDRFCTIKSIVVFRVGEEELCGIFADEYDVGDPICGVSHIVPIVRNCGTCFFPMGNVRNSAIIITVSGKDYVMPTANQYEIE